MIWVEWILIGFFTGFITFIVILTLRRKKQ